MNFPIAKWRPSRIRTRKTNPIYAHFNKTHSSNTTADVAQWVSAWVCQIPMVMSSSLIICPHQLFAAENQSRTSRIVGDYIGTLFWNQESRRISAGKFILQLGSAVFEWVLSPLGKILEGVAVKPMSARELLINSKTKRSRMYSSTLKQTDHWAQTHSKSPKFLHLFSHHQANVPPISPKNSPPKPSHRPSMQAGQSCLRQPSPDKPIHDASRGLEYVAVAQDTRPTGTQGITSNGGFRPRERDSSRGGGCAPSRVGWPKLGHDGPRELPRFRISRKRLPGWMQTLRWNE
jgi:hypothetical protein